MHVSAPPQGARRQAKVRLLSAAVLGLSLLAGGLTSAAPKD
jgi:hypothetical protein